MSRSAQLQRGHSLSEMLTVIAVLGLVLAVTLPAFATLRRKDALRAAVSEIRGLFWLARARAIARGRNVGLKFRNERGSWTYAMYEDGDGDGVRSDDIRKGLDSLIHTARLIARDQTEVTFGFPSFPVTDPDSGKVLAPNTSPVRFNNSALCSFSPTGTATAGSIFLTNTHHDAVVVRVYAPTAKIRVLRFDRSTKRWR